MLSWPLHVGPGGDGGRATFSFFTHLLWSLLTLRRRVVRVEAGAVSQTSAFAEIPCAWEQSHGAPSAMTHCGKMSTTLKSGMWQKWAQGDERGLL